MSKTLSYADAIRLLGSNNSKIVNALDRITGGLILGTVGSVPAMLGLFDAKAEFIRLCHDLVRSVSERRSGLSRHGRTERLKAAHTVVVVVAYFEALAEAELPFPFADLQLTTTDQICIGHRIGFPESGGEFLDALQSAGAILPLPQYAHELLLEALGDYYAGLSSTLSRFVTGLAVWDQLKDSDRRQFVRALQALPQRACERYEESLRRLAADFPEVACWANLREHQATREEIRGVGAALAGLERMLEEVSVGRAPDERRRELGRAYRAALDRPVVTAGELPSDVQLPTGSGKSLLTQLLAGRPPVTDYLPVRVVLREVSTTAHLQDQIEHAIRNATGQRVDWPALARSAGATPYQTAYGRSFDRPRLVVETPAIALAALAISSRCGLGESGDGAVAAVPVRLPQRLPLAQEHRIPNSSPPAR